MTQQPVCVGEGCDGPNVGSSHPHTSRVYNGHLELFIWMYVDTNVKDDPLGGLDNLMISIISIILIIATILIRLLIEYLLFRSIV